MPFEIYAFVAAFGVMLLALGGVIFSNRLAREFLEQRLAYLISFSAGVFLVVSFLLALEVFEIAESLAVGVGLIVMGYVVASLVQRFLPETHHHHDEHCTEPRVGVRSLIIGDGIHNIADGIVIVSAFAVSATVGIVATVSIMIHEALQETAEYFVLRRAGYSARKALMVNFAVSSTILLGVLLGSLALAAHDLEVFLLALSAGFFAQVVIHDLLPRPGHHETGRDFMNHLLIVICGSILMGTINFLLGETHAHESEQAAVQGEGVGYSDYRDEAH